MEKGICKGYFGTRHLITFDHEMCPPFKSWLVRQLLQKHQYCVIVVVGRKKRPVSGCIVYRD